MSSSEAEKSPKYFFETMYEDDFVSICVRPGDSAEDRDEYLLTGYYRTISWDSKVKKMKYTGRFILSKNRGELVCGITQFHEFGDDADIFVQWSKEQDYIPPWGLKAPCIFR